MHQACVTMMLDTDTASVREDEAMRQACGTMMHQALVTMMHDASSVREDEAMRLKPAER